MPTTRDLPFPIPDFSIILVLMSQPSLFSSSHLTVSQLTFRIRKLLEGDLELQDVWVEGEISNLLRVKTQQAVVVAGINDSHILSGNPYS